MGWAPRLLEPHEEAIVRTPVPVLAVLVLLAGCSSSSGGGTPKSDTTTPPAAPAAATGGLRIANFAYSPSPFTAKPGEKIAVTNNDVATHTVTSDVTGLFSTDDANKGVPVTFTAPTKAGTYTFYCAYHANMHGTLVVKS
jgi:plastocyanin